MSVSKNEESNVFQKFGYGAVRFTSGFRLRGMLNEAEPAAQNHSGAPVEEQTESGLRVVTFGKHSRPVHYVKLTEKCSVGVFKEDNGNVEIVPNTIYVAGHHKPIDLKKEGVISAIFGSELKHTVGEHEAKSAKRELKKLKLVAFADTQEDKVKDKSNGAAAAMVGGRSSGRTFISKIPNATFNAAVFFLITPLIALVFGFRKAHSHTEEMRDKMASVNAAHVTNVNKVQEKPQQVETTNQSVQTLGDISGVKPKKLETQPPVPEMQEKQTRSHVEKYAGNTAGVRQQ